MHSKFLIYHVSWCTMLSFYKQQDIIKKEFTTIKTSKKRISTVFLTILAARISIMKDSCEFRTGGSLTWNICILTTHPFTVKVNSVAKEYAQPSNVIKPAYEYALLFYKNLDSKPTRETTWEIWQEERIFSLKKLQHIEMHPPDRPAKRGSDTPVNYNTMYKRVQGGSADTFPFTKHKTSNINNDKSYSFLNEPSTQLCCVRKSFSR